MLPSFLKKQWVGVNNKIMSLFKTNITKNYSKPTGVNNVYGGWKKLRKPKIEKQLEDKIIREIEDRIIRYIKNLFEQEENYYKPVGAGNFYSNSYIDYENNGDKNTILSIKEYLDEVNHTLKTSSVISKNLIHGKFNKQ